MSKNVPQEIQEAVVQYYIDEPDVYKTAKSLIPVLETFGYKIGERNIALWKAFQAAQEERRAQQLERCRDKMSQSLEEILDELIGSLKFNTIKINKIKRMMEIEGEGSAKHAKCVIDLEKMEKINAGLYDKYTTFLKHLNTNSPYVKSDEDTTETFDDIMAALKGK